jgi:hypothetical protein
MVVTVMEEDVIVEDTLAMVVGHGTAIVGVPITGDITNVI